MKKSACTTRIDAYFNTFLPENGEEIADVESLAVYLDMTREELLALEHDRVCGHAVQMAKARIAAMKKQLAFRGKIPAAVLAFDFKNNHGYLDRPENNEETVTLVLEGKAKDWAK